MLFNIISYYIMSQRADGSVSALTGLIYSEEFIDILQQPKLTSFCLDGRWEMSLPSSSNMHLKMDPQ